MLATLVAVVLAQAQSQDPDVQKLFAWYDSMDVAQYLSKPFVKIENAWWDYRIDFGFLIEDKPTSVRILTTSLALVELSKENKYQRKMSVEPADLKAVLTSSVEFYGSEEDYDKKHKRVHTATPHTTLAWLCHKSGLPTQATKMIEINRKWNAQYEEANPHLDKSHFEFVYTAKRFAMEPVLHLAVLDFENESLEWSDLQTRFEEFEARYKDHPSQDDVSKILSGIRINIEEEKNHKTKDKTAELIWSLPYQKIKGGWSASNDASRTLIDKGFVVTPALINALDDERLTRSIAHQWSGPPISHSYRTIEQVGDHARVILERIASRSFYSNSKEETKKQAQDWYESVKNHGEKEVLKQTARKGSYEGLSSAEALAEKYPKEAFEPIVEGYKKSNDDYRGYYVAKLIDISGKAVDEFVLRVATTDKSLGARVAALFILLDRNSKRATELAIAEWKNLKGEGDGFEVDNLVSLLHDTNNVLAINAMAKDLRKRPIDVRREVLTNGTTPNYRRRSKVAFPASRVFSNEVINALEDLYASELNDAEVWNGGMSGGGYSLEAPKLSTIALLSLSQLRYGIYTFTNSKNEKDYEPQRLKALEVYKKRRSK